MEQRAAFRYATDLEADCRMSGRTWSARLRNISTTGCMIANPEGGLPEGWMLRLRIEGLPLVDTEIIWRHRGHAGLRFMVPLASSALEHLGFHLPEPRPANDAGGERELGGLHAQLVKRLAPDESVRPAAATAATVRSAFQLLS